jgi:hypothetical protein
MKATEGWLVSAAPRPLYPRGRDPVPIVQETGWSPGPVWTGAENIASTGIFVLYFLVLCASSVLVCLS